MDIELDDGTASGEMVLAVSQEILDMAGGDPADLFAETDVPEGARVEPYEEDDYVGQRYVFEDVELDEFSDQQLSITYDEESGRYEVNGTMDFGTEDDLTDLSGGMAEAVAETFDVSISVTFPGDVVEHNGDLDGRTVTWRAGFDDVTEMHAVAEEGGSGVSVWAWVTLAVLAAALLGGLVITRRRREEAGDVTSPDTATYGDATGEPSSSMPDQPTRDLTPTDHAGHDESPASEAVLDEVAPHGESPASEAVHDDLSPHERSLPTDTVPDDVAPHEQSPMPDGTSETAQGDVRQYPDEPGEPDGDKR